MVVPNCADNIALINCLKEFDCCSRCIIRFLNVEIGSDKIYTDPEVYLKGILNENVDIDVPFKKFKRNPCRICLDILQDSTIEKFSENVKFTNVLDYKYSDFRTHTSFPKSLMIRSHSMDIYLKEKFPKVYCNGNGIDTIGKIFKIASTSAISQLTSKVFNPQSNLNVTFEVEYEDDNLETQNIKKLKYLMKRGRQQEASKNVIMEILAKCDDATFRKFFTVPPPIPIKEPTVKVHCSAESMWIGGRYLKFSRNMGQTPWIVKDKIKAKHNLQDIIFDGLEKILGWDRKKLTFCASGREDSDVRMLGNGRPFYVQIDDPKDKHVTFEQCRAIEREIFASNVAAVVKLQTVPKYNLKKLKDGEQNKRKHYHALCQIDAEDMNAVVNKINAFSNAGLDILQKTPLRVLHRRTQDVRKKCIYNMEAEIVTGSSNLIEVKLITQAGTYVKEFVNGDFQRTTPSLTSILNLPIDIVALDVTNIDLAWPEE